MITYADDLERVLGYLISKMDFSKVTENQINYHWGDQTELNRYLILKGENIAVKNALKGQNEQLELKYPLIWLVLPNTGVKAEADWVIHRGTRLVIAKNTRTDVLNATRWNVSFSLLSGIANILLNKLNGKFTQVYQSNQIPQVKVTKYPLYSVNGKDNITIDVWDALVLDIDIIVKTDCITNEILNYDKLCL